jgi:electron transport complex protein RnfE
VGAVVFDALGIGLGYTWVLTGISVVRELFGTGAILGFQILPDSYQPILFFVLPPGGFFVFALFMALNMAIKAKQKKNEDATPALEGGHQHHGAAS